VLTELVMHNMPADAQATAASHSLALLTSLRHLVLSSPSSVIGWANVRPLHQGFVTTLAHFTRLSHLDLCDVHISVACLRHLPAQLSVLKVTVSDSKPAEASLQHMIGLRELKLASGLAELGQMLLPVPTGVGTVQGVPSCKPDSLDCCC
jgi:hypothetical protein